MTRARETKGPVLIEFRVEKEDAVYPMVPAGSDLHAMIDLAIFLKRNGYRPDQVQDFIPAPFSPRERVVTNARHPERR